MKQLCLRRANGVATRQKQMNLTNVLTDTELLNQFKQLYATATRVGHTNVASDKKFRLGEPNFIDCAESRQEKGISEAKSLPNEGSGILFS